ncbi:hypothetical protein B0T17DRAFT_538366 [Bombardia bombarda]|uniref:LIM zinc-binding domain-containing protein n=1 Tax=Bombardia bombarda TaxID=252184 RepID=A0AA39WNC8_9PEZI|nr:hypothetical protein B0T17DRAFT_538366 [Bombardia bombarda]
MFNRSKSTERKATRKVTPPSPSYMSNEQFAAYLADLRSNRVNRPGGARPPPPSKRDAASTVPAVPASLAIGRPPPGVSTPSETLSSLGHQRNHSDASSTPSILPPVTSRITTPVPAGATPGRPSMSASVSSRFSSTTRGRDYYPDRPAQPLKPSEIVPTATYIERGQRWMEKEEAVSLRQAMEDMDLKEEPKQEGCGPENDEERRLYEAALDEAAELVWRHQNPGKVPQPGAPYRYNSHLRKNSYAHARTASAGMYGSDVAPTGLARDPTSRSISSSSTEDDDPGSTRSRSSFASSRHAQGPGESAHASLDRSRNISPEPRTPKVHSATTSRGYPSAIHSGRRRSSLKRNISGEIQKPFSGDQIWEEPDGRTSNSFQNPAQTGPDQPLKAKAKNPLNRVQFAPAVPPVVDASPPAPPKRVSKYEIYRNPPSQSRNPQYTTNQRSESPAAVVERTPVPRKHGMEIRSEDIRQATSMKLKERSTKLPTPSAVSDSPGRPIVSFDRDWKPQEEATDDAPAEPRHGRAGGGRGSGSGSGPSPLVSGRNHSQHPPHPTQNMPTISVSDHVSSPSPHAAPPSRRPQPAPPTFTLDGPPEITVSASAPPIPTIVFPDGPDDEPGVPLIITPDGNENKSSSRPLPTPQPGAPRIRQQPARARGHWSPAANQAAGSRATARCHECGHFIEGRFVSLAGSSERFHPQCFTCYTCGTLLEALEISPEPDAHRAARLERIARRAVGEILPEQPGETMAEDGDARLRLYCHLDWHELYAPRCKHCRTPIMGEHVVALGSHWHFGHFFCAECGDPFERGMTHIEKDGYAWCVSCQTKRTERRAPKCRRCKKAVIGQYVQALGGEWHDECFRCATCGGGFDDGQVFPRNGRGGPGESIVLCTGCMEKELKA